MGWGGKKGGKGDQGGNGNYGSTPQATRPSRSTSRGRKGAAGRGEDEPSMPAPRRGQSPFSQVRSSSLPAHGREKGAGQGARSKQRPSSVPPRRQPLKSGTVSWDHPDGLPIEDLEAGAVLAGVVVNSVKFGVFVDVGAEVNALLQIPSRYWRKFARGDHLDECIIQDVDFDRRRITVALEDPDHALAINRTALEELSPGMYVEGVIDHKNRFGVWVNVFAENMGRLNLQRRYTSRFLNGQVVRNIVIESVDLERRKLGLTLENPEDAVTDELVMVGIPPPEPGMRRPRNQAKSKAKAKAKQARQLQALPPATLGPQAGDWVNGVVTNIVARGVVVDIGTDRLGTLVVSAELKAQMQKGDQIQGMKVERVSGNGAATLSMEDPMLEIDDPDADFQARPQRKPQERPKAMPPGPPGRRRNTPEARAEPRAGKGGRPMR